MKSDPRVVCIGNFDGVHKGHQALLAAARSISPHVITLTFEPHPRQIFKPDDPCFRITSPVQKNNLLRQFGACEIITLPFGTEFSGISACDFVEAIIIKQAKADHVIVGCDFCFGYKRAGTVDLLQRYADAGKFKLTIIDAVSDGQDRYSSTSIREVLQLGDITRVNDLLGWSYAIEEEVIHGDARGREIGFPTANQKANGRLLPRFGVYASRVVLDGKTYMAATNIGIRPMFVSPEPLIETHILDFDGDLYGLILHVEPVARLRGEEKYDSLDALITQLQRDCAQARDLLSLPS